MPKRVVSGRRDRQITIQKLVQPDQKDSDGTPIADWTTLTPLVLFASKEDELLPDRAREVFRADQLSARGETRWGCPYHADIDPELVDVPKLRRVTYLGRTYDITAANMVGRRRGVQLVTLAKVG